jgi:hypothetical protein
VFATLQEKHSVPNALAWRKSRWRYTWDLVQQQPLGSWKCLHALEWGVCTVRATLLAAKVSPATHPSAARQFFSTGSTTHPARFSTLHSALSSLEHKPNANTQAKAEQSKSTTRLHPRDGLLPVDSKIGRPLVAKQSCWASINRGWRMPCLFSCSLLSPVSTALGMLTRITVLDCATGLQ